MKGKIVLCEGVDSGTPAFVAGAAGVVYRDDGDKDVAFLFPLPASNLGEKDGTSVFDYINMTRYHRFEF